MTQLVILGAGGHGAVVAEAAVASDHWESVGFLEDNPEKGDSVVGCPIIGKTTAWPDFVANDRVFLVAMGDNRQRDEVLSELEKQGAALASILHPSAVISPSASIGAGSAVLAGAVINARAILGRGCILNSCASIDHDCVLGKAVHISPGAHVAGGVTIGNHSWIGLGASIKEGIVIGANAVVGAGAAVISDVEDDAIVGGVPAVPLRIR